jgi:hypothetical protein
MKRETEATTLAQMTARYREHNDRIEAKQQGDLRRGLLRPVDMAEVAERLRAHFGGSK